MESLCEFGNRARGLECEQCLALDLEDDVTLCANIRFGNDLVVVDAFEVVSCGLVGSPNAMMARWFDILRLEVGMTASNDALGFASNAI